MKDIQFRISEQFGVSEEYKTIVPKGVMDRYTIGFLNALFYTENCYHCQYARQERVSDITLGDSWGSLLPKHERNQGISLALIQTEKGQKLLDWADLHLEPVDLDKATVANHQLTAPSVAPPSREKFFKEIKKGKSFYQLVTKCYPKTCLRQDLKQILLHFPFIGKIARSKGRLWG